MKRSRIVLGIGVFMLAAAGAVAAVNAPTQTQYFYYSSSGACQTVVEEFNCTILGTDCEGTIDEAAGQQLYRNRTGVNTCANSLEAL